MHELSPWSMFLNADLFVKAVMTILALASVITWTVFLAKFHELGRARRNVTGALARIGSSRSLNEARGELADDAGVVAALLRAATHEWALSGEAVKDLQERAASHFAEIAKDEGARARRGTGVLATIGAVAPFVGLLGTVWGIMNAFIGISKAQTTNLAVVAPGIAEALLATAIGLVAAIPAVVFYNAVTRSAKTYLETVQRASGATGRLLSRDLDRAKAHEPGAPRRAPMEA
jgi:biopolymer transport protein ExbB